MVGMITGFRAAALGGRLPLDLIVASTVVAVLLLTIGLRYFTSVERRFADVI
jgi:ABC-type polysaccharide/polyol phosphate export permease